MKEICFSTYVSGYKRESLSKIKLINQLLSDCNIEHQQGCSPVDCSAHCKIQRLIITVLNSDGVICTLQQ